MKYVLCLVLALATPGLAFATDVGVSISVGEPGFYGRIDIGHVPPPVVLYPEPVIIEAVPVGVVRQPVYMHVPPGHAKKWKSYCHQYGACGLPVLFVQNSWYDEVYVPAHRKAHGGGKGKGHKGEGKGGPHGKGDKGNKGNK